MNEHTKIHWHDKINPSLHFAVECKDVPEWIEPLRVIYDHEIVIVKEGSYKIDIEGEEYFLQKDNYIIIPPGKTHTSSNLTQSNGTRLCIHFDWINSYGPWDIGLHCMHPCKPNEELYRPTPDFMPKKNMHGQTPKECFELFQRIEHLSWGSSAHEKCIARTLLLQFFMELFDGKDNNAPNLREQFSLPSIAKQKINPLATISISDTPSLQSTLSFKKYSYSHVCREFKKRYGMTPGAYLTTLRMNKAKSLLKDTELNLTEISIQVGYDDPAYFSRTFKKLYSVSPRSYRVNSSH